MDLLSGSGASNVTPTTETAGKVKGDPFWVYGTKVNGGRRSTCLFCNKEFGGGITRLKQHLAGAQGDCGPCLKVSAEVRQKAKDSIIATKAKKDTKEATRQAILHNVSINTGEHIDDNINSYNHRSGSSNARGPMDAFVYPSPNEVEKSMDQPNLSETRKRERDNTCAYIARFLFEAGISFNVVNMTSFKEMVQAIGLHGPNMKPPSMHEISEKFLPLEKDKMDESLSSFKETCRIQGCSLMTDCWTDRRGRSIMNLVVNCNSKTVFMQSKNASGDIHNARYICDFVLDGIKELGEDNIVQIVTDNASNNMSAAKLLFLEHPRIFWTSCAAHTINLMLKDIGAIKPILRRADGDIPSMGWLYGDLENSKNEIAEALNQKEKRYRAIWAIIDKRWNNKLKNELHLTGYLLNPVHYYNRREEIEDKQEFIDGFSSCLFKMYKNDHLIQDDITKELGVYQNQEGTFASEPAIRQRKSPSFSSVNWWKLHGGSTPNLKKMAIRVLSLTTSSSGCERAWSTFEMIHSKKRNRLSTDKLRDLVFVKFNSQLKSKFGAKTRDALLASHHNEGLVDEWLGASERLNNDTIASDDYEDDEVFPGEALTWAEVAKAMGSEASKKTRRARKRTRTSRVQSSRKGKELFIEDNELEMSDEDTSSTSDSDSTNGE